MDFARVIGGSEVGGGPETLSFIEALGVFKSERKKKPPKQVSEIIIFFNVVIIFKIYFLKGFSMYIGSSGFVTKSCLTLVTPWTLAHQAPLSMGFPSQEY